MPPNIPSNPQGLEVRDLIAELQRYHPNARTNTTGLNPSNATNPELILADETESLAHKAAAEEWKRKAEGLRCEYYAWQGKANRVAGILRHVKQLSRSRRLPLP